MSFWQLVFNNPEWVSVFANAIFAVTTIAVIIWQVYVMKAQVRVMKWQARRSARNEQIQNRLIRLQHEHEWVLRRNQEREQLLKLARKLQLDVGCLQHASSDADSRLWGELQDTIYELDSRLSILDVATFTGVYDQWFFSLSAYVDAVLKAVIDEPNQSPSPSTRKALHDAEQRHEPAKIFLGLEAAIRMEFFEFKEKWDAELVSRYRPGDRTDPSAARPQVTSSA